MRQGEIEPHILMVKIQDIEDTKNITFTLNDSQFGSQILVFHFPGVIERVKRGVPNQVAERPFAGQLPSE
jgi:hypothetical protein